MTQQFDVFLAHNSKDKPLIRQIYQQLKARGLRPWLDEEEIAPGTLFQDEIQQAIGQIEVAAICIGQNEFGRWQALELKAFISQCVRSGIKVIPVLLPGVQHIPARLLFLEQFHAVSFENSIGDEQAFFRLEWGITGQKPSINPEDRQSATVSWEEEDNLASERGIDYSRLQKLLKDKDWKAADRETYEVMIRAVGKKPGNLFNEDELLNFPCADLLTIDRLWVTESNGRFGFSVQKQIYVECGGKLDGKYPGDTIWRKFGEKVGWYRSGSWCERDSWISYSEVTFDASAPKGHLPEDIIGGISLLSHRDL